MIRTEGMTQAAMDNDTMMAVTPEAMAAAIEAERGVIFAARSIANRDCGGSQTEMREAREAYMIDAFAKFEREVIARHQSGRTGAGEALPKWVYDIQWGPEGQQDYAHVYDLGGNLIAVMKTHDAARIAKHRGCDQ